MRHLVVIISLAGFACSPAHAETVAATMAKWGLTGEWSGDCGTPAARGRANKLRYVTRSDGSVVHARNFGDIASSDEIRAARITPEGWLELQIRFHNVAEDRQDRTFAVRKIRPGVIQAAYNYDAKGEYSVRDGKFTRNGNDAPLQYKCD